MAIDKIENATQGGVMVKGAVSSGRASATGKPAQSQLTIAEKARQEPAAARVPDADFAALRKVSQASMQRVSQLATDSKPAQSRAATGSNAAKAARQGSAAKSGNTKVRPAPQSQSSASPAKAQRDERNEGARKAQPQKSKSNPPANRDRAVAEKGGEPADKLIQAQQKMLDTCFGLCEINTNAVDACASECNSLVESWVRDSFAAVEAFYNPAVRKDVFSFEDSLLKRQFDRNLDAAQKILKSADRCARQMEAEQDAYARSCQKLVRDALLAD